MIDKDQVKQAARGRWPEILPTLGGISAEILDGRHYPCPFPGCPGGGGKDRFRALDDFPETGGVICNQCHHDQGDGIGALMKATGKQFPDVLKMLADHLGMNENGNGKASGNKPTAAGKKKTLAESLEKIKPISAAGSDTLLLLFCRSKPPITVAGIKACGGVLVRWWDTNCVRFEGRNPIDATVPTAVVLVPADGKPFPATKRLSERKTHSAEGSRDSWLLAGDVATADTVLDVEGISDLLAAVSAGLPPGWAAVTNTAGANARGKLPRPWAAGKKIIVAGDADVPGQDGQQRGAAAYCRAGAAEVLLVELPYAIEPDHGKDLRDALNDGHRLAELPTAAVTADQAAAWSKTKAPEYVQSPRGAARSRVR